MGMNIKNFYEYFGPDFVCDKILDVCVVIILLILVSVTLLFQTKIRTETVIDRPIEPRLMNSKDKEPKE